MKSKIFMLFVVLMLVLTACGGGAEPAAPEAPAADAPEADAPAEEASLEGVPEAFTGEPLKVAVIRNLPSDDHTKQFLDGARTEGESFGMVVDTFIADNDDAKFQELVAQAITKGYDGLIISHGKADYSYDMLKPAVDAGMQVVTFDTVIEKDGETLPSITTTFQDDFALAELSVGEIAALTDGTEKVIKLWWGPGVPPLDRRETVYAPMEAAGEIETVEVIGPTNFQDVQGDIAAKVGAVLAKYPEGTVDAIWGSWDEMAKGAYTALKDAGRTDITLISIDVSNQDMNLMREEGSVWLSTAAVDPGLIGIVDMRLLAMQFAGEDTPDNYDLEARLVKGSDLLPETKMLNLGDVVPGWGQSSAFNQEWMNTLRVANGGEASEVDSGEAAAPAAEETAEEVAIPEVFTGEQMKIAVIRNLPSDDHTKQFLDGARTEGESFGMVVDTFIADNDDAKFQELVAQAIIKGYDGLIISHGKADYSYDMLKPAIDAGIEVVTFDTVIEKDGETLPTITTTFQDDFALAELSVGEIAALTDGTEKIIKLWWGPGVPPLDRRETVYAPMEAAGEIETVEVIGPTNFQDVQGDIAAKVGAVLAKYPEGTVDAIWGSWDEMAKGAYTALKDAGRTDITLISIDISNQDMNLMREEGSVWVSTAAVDPGLIGIVDMRLLAMQLAGEETPDNYDLEARLVKGSDLLPETNMLNLGDVVPGWGESDAFNQPWMDALRAAQ
jgi:simple sugar transport system substrate-binding protein